jgi:antitoxin (DNA-binding transcriptional repressor) of toxin-antitoxin stability system
MRTGRWMREAAKHGQVLVTSNGRPVAKILPETAPAQTPFFAQRRYVNPKARKLIESGRLGQGGTDSTAAISEDREDRA